MISLHFYVELIEELKKSVSKQLVGVWQVFCLKKLRSEGSYHLKRGQEKRMIGLGRLSIPDG